MDSCIVVVFAKAPRAGSVKTRLLPHLDAQGAARLHANLLTQSVATARRAAIGPIELWGTPDLDHPLFDALEKTGVSLRRQEGADLGARMRDATNDVLERASSVLVIGSDCPGLLVDDLRTAARWLVDDVEAVLGPAEDGGYYLLGLRQPAPALFIDMPWSTDAVARLSRARLQHLGWRWRELPQRWDVDRPEDYRRLLDDPALRGLTENVWDTLEQNPLQHPAA